MKKVLTNYLWIFSITAAILLLALLTFPVKENPLYIKKMIKDKTLNLFGAPIPKDTLIKYYDKLEKYIK